VEVEHTHSLDYFESVAALKAAMMVILKPMGFSKLVQFEDDEYERKFATKKEGDTEWHVIVATKSKDEVNTIRKIQVAYPDKNYITPYTIEYIGRRRYMIMMPDMEWKTAEIKDERMFWRALIQVLEILHAMHGLKIVHRNIKPARLLVHEDRIVLHNFDVAELVKNPVKFDFCGTEGYRLKEKCNVYSAYAADIYAAAMSFARYYKWMPVEHQTPKMKACLTELLASCIDVPYYDTNKALRVLSKCKVSIGD
jgi:serine/threonine protein kinase